VSSLDPLTGDDVALFNPRRQIWQEHFRWANDQQTIIGLILIGRVIVEALHMNSELRSEARRLWFASGLLP